MKTSDLVCHYHFRAGAKIRPERNRGLVVWWGKCNFKISIGDICGNKSVTRDTHHQTCCHATEKSMININICKAARRQRIPISHCFGPQVLWIVDVFPHDFLPKRSKKAAAIHRLIDLNFSSTSFLPSYEFSCALPRLIICSRVLLLWKINISNKNLA